jgi:acetyl esterase/lipase
MSRIVKLFLLSILILALAGCSPLTLVNSIAPDHGFEVEQGIYYGQQKRQKLDVYYPEVSRSNAPVIVFFYGGSWRRGDRERYRFVGQALSSQGYLTVIPDYRLYPEVEFPAFVEDGAASIAWIKQNIPQSENGIVLIGHSAGAHLAALLALDGRYLYEKKIVSQNSIIGMNGLAGPYAFEPEQYRRFRPIFANAEPAELSQPVSHARGDAPPLLLLHGTDDRIVLPLHSQLLQERMNSEDGRVKRLELDGVGHFGIVLALSKPFAHFAPNLLPSIENFIQEQI